MRRRGRGTILGTGIALAQLITATCYRPEAHDQAIEHPATYAPLTSEQQRFVTDTLATAHANPHDFDVQKRAGLALLQLTLSGALNLQTTTESLLERAYTLRSTDAELNRVLGRFYNLRAVEHDFSKVAWQQRVYASLLGDRPADELSDQHFVAYSFFSLAQIIELADRGKRLAALRRLRRLERELDRRVDANPHNVEIQALAGNFALFFAGNVPLGRRRRIDTGIERFEYVRAHWDAMPPAAKDPHHCPNTYENFMFELAEAHLARRHDEAARSIYQELAEVASPPTRAKELIARVSQHRLDHLDEYRGDLDLMPPWPSDVGNCVVCHSYTGDIPDHTLVTHKPLDLSSVPTQAQPKPVQATSSIAVATGYPPHNNDLRALVEQRCEPCHFPGGRAYGALDLSTYASAVEHAKWIVEAIDHGEMPPEKPLPTAERQVFHRWMRSLDANP